MNLLNILNKYLEEAKAGDTVTSPKGKKVSVESGARGREKVIVDKEEHKGQDKYTVNIKNKEGEVKEKTKSKASKYTKYVDAVKAKDKSRFSNTKDEEKAKKKLEPKKKGGKKRVAKWWENEEEFKKVMLIDPKAKQATQSAIEQIRASDEENKGKKQAKKTDEVSKKREEKKPVKKTAKKKKVAESVYPRNPKAIKQIVEEYLNPEQEEVRKYFK